MNETIDQGPNAQVINIEQLTLANTNYRTTLWTGQHLQATLMSIDPGHDIGLEVHTTHDQFLRIESGHASVQIGPDQEHLTTQSAAAGDAVFVPSGSWHNMTNDGNESLKVYSIYSPVQHPHGTIHVTKQDAASDEHDQ